MGNEPDIALIDPHSKRHRRYYHPDTVVQKPVLDLLAQSALHPPVIGRRRDLLRHQVLGKGFGLFPGKGIDDPTLVGVCL